MQPNANSVIMENVRMLIEDQEAQCTVANFPHVFKNRRINKTDDWLLVKSIIVISPGKCDEGKKSHTQTV